MTSRQVNHQRLFGVQVIFSNAATSTRNNLNICSVRTRPFQHTGADFAGPIYVKCGPNIKKSYVALFTCASTRAVHLSLASDSAGPTFQLSMEKFVAKWGMPNLMISDNASTFKSTAVQLSLV